MDAGMKKLIFSVGTTVAAALVLTGSAKTYEVVSMVSDHEERLIAIERQIEALPRIEARQKQILCMLSEMEGDPCTIKDLMEDN